MADEHGANGGGSNGRKAALIAGLGLVGVGAYQLMKKPVAPAAPPAPTPPPASPTWPPWARVLAQPSLEVRSGPQFFYPVTGSLAYGTYVRILCQGFGALVGNSRVWDQIGPSPGAPGGGYISDWWMSTPGVGVLSGGVPQCAGIASTPDGGGATSGSGGTKTGILPPTGSPPVNIPPISSPNAVQVGWIISTGCGWNQADYVVIHDVNGYGGRLSRVWIRDYATWQRLGAPRNAVRIVTANVIYSIRDRGTIYFDGSWHFNSNPAGWWLISGLSSPPNVVASNAGYCS